VQDCGTPEPAVGKLGSVSFKQVEPGPDTQDIELLAVLQALADPIRLEIVQAMGANPGGVYCRTFARHLSKATRSYHLRLLRDAGLTNTYRDGAFKIITLRRTDLDARFPGLVDGILAEAPAIAPTAVPTGAPPLVIAA
jgi:DNA-binding transcriptional ArsR family regulator